MSAGPARAVTLGPTAGRRGATTRRLALASCLLGMIPALSQAADLVATIRSVKPGVLAIGTYNAQDSPRFTFRGTGFVVGDGRQALTNWHVLPGAQQAVTGALVVLWPGNDPMKPDVRAARLARGDAEHDLALLEFSGPPLPALTLDASTPVPEGTEVLLLGFPLGTTLGVGVVSHRAMVSAIAAIAIPAGNSAQLDAKTAQRLRQGPFDIYQLDGTAYPGTSGSPLVDAASGKVIGIVNMAFVKGTKESAISAPSGISYAIPARHADALLVPRQ